jgi:hypothetical protein
MQTVGKTACPLHLALFAKLKHLDCLMMFIAMSRYRRADIPGVTCFFTVVTYRRRPILCDDSLRAALCDAVKTVQS